MNFVSFVVQHLCGSAALCESSFWAALWLDGLQLR